MAQKYALVTGGNRGIGLEVCTKLLERGKPVLLTARTHAAASAAARQLQQQHQVDVQPFALEAGDPSSIQQLAAELGQRFNQSIDLVVNNAAILVCSVWDEATYNETLAVNVAGPLLLTQQLLPALPPGSLVIMVSSGNGASAHLTPDYIATVRGVSNVQQLQQPLAVAPFVPASPMGSQPSTNPGAMAPTYSVSKALLNRAVQLLALPGSPLSQAGVCVAAVSPGWCRTDMGTAQAERSAAEGADSVLWPWLHWEQQLNGSFTRDGITVDW